ncbi:L-rhamnono-gamma-lactonase [Teratosphaeriaceae sp. CCFEE 6253]|nr:L-rhamnono-gamma-lactonase [Teratosphaeriaceae sp. CCFEE 6253]
MPLAKPHLLEKYYAVSDQSSLDADVKVRGVVYVETDVSYDDPTDDVATWARGPLDEIGFLRDVVEGRYTDRDGEMLLGLVPWAPMHQTTHVLEEYLKLVEKRAGPHAWGRVKGFRFLLQSLLEPEDFTKLTSGDDFIANLQLLGRKGFSFDVGVDQHRAGAWQMEAMAQAMQKAHADVAEGEKVIFVINHLCKPDMHCDPAGVASGRGPFQEWSDAVAAMSKCSGTYMKLSGQFSEMRPGLKTVEDIAHSITPWARHVLETFGPRRTMFGSDWPVCNVDGPLGGQSWVAWKDVTKLLLADPELGLSDTDRDWIWSKTAAEAYRLQT